MKATFTFALLGAVALAQRYNYQGGRNEEDFMEFISREGKQYRSQAEFNGRYNLFMQSNEKVRELRRMSPLAKFDVNFSSDWTDEEFAALLGAAPSLGERMVYQEDVQDALYLQSSPYMLKSTMAVDWRTSGNLSPVKAQGYCGSCWVFNASVVLETMVSAVKSAEKGYLVPPVRVSEQEGVDCTYDRDGCLGGWPDNYWQMTINRGGAQFSDVYPYEEEYNGGCQSQSDIKNKTLENPRATTYGRLPYTTDGVIAKLEMGPLSVAVAGGNDVWRYYSGGIVTAEDYCPTRLDHAVVLVAYTPPGPFDFPAEEPLCRYARRSEFRRGCKQGLVLTGNLCCQGEGKPARTEDVEAYWTIQNSWGAGWGDGGFMNIDVTDSGVGICGMNDWIDYLEI